MDAGESERHPLTMYNGISTGVPVLTSGMPYTASLVLRTTGGATAHLVNVRPIAHSDNLELVGTSAAGPDRNFGQAMGSHGYPPADLPKAAQTVYQPIEEVPIRPDDPRNPQGVDVLLGVRFQSGSEAWFDGVEVTYSVGEETYIGEFPVSWAMCDHPDCEAPTIGKPWSRA